MEEKRSKGMSDTLLHDSAGRLFATQSTAAVVNAAEAGEWPAALWRAVEDAGFLDVLAAADGFSLETLPDACTILRVAARHAAPIPLLEPMLARWLVAGAGLELTADPVAIAPTERHDRVEIDAAGRVSASLYAVPWAGSCKRLVAVSNDRIALAELPETAGGTSLAGELQGGIVLERSPARVAALPAGIDRELVYRLGALGRAAQMVGAMEAALALATDYAGTRIQFGRTLAKLQVIQHQLAIMGEEVAAAAVAVESAAEEVARGGDVLLAVAAAKIRAGEAAGKAAEIAHQVHGAIGFTHEHRLHQFTRRLWSWRDEFGTESEWSLELGRRMGRAGADALWPMVVGQ
jgi:hypothetical protein